MSGDSDDRCGVVSSPLQSLCLTPTSPRTPAPSPECTTVKRLSGTSNAYFQMASKTQVRSMRASMRAALCVPPRRCSRMQTARTSRPSFPRRPHMLDEQNEQRHTVRHAHVRQYALKISRSSVATMESICVPKTLRCRASRKHRFLDKTFWLPLQEGPFEGASFKVQPQVPETKKRKKPE